MLKKSPYAGDLRNRGTRSRECSDLGSMRGTDGELYRKPANLETMVRGTESREKSTEMNLPDTHARPGAKGELPLGMR